MWLVHTDDNAIQWSWHAAGMIDHHVALDSVPDDSNRMLWKRTPDGSWADLGQRVKQVRRRPVACVAASSGASILNHFKAKNDPPGISSNVVEMTEGG